MPENRIKKLKLKSHQLEGLPLFYNFILYNHMEQHTPHFHYDKKRQHYINYVRPEILLSKIVDYGKE